MAKRGQTPGEALRKRDAFIAGMKSAARQAAWAGNCQQALTFLARALHTLMDSTSPAHVDPNGNPYAFPSKNLLRHIPIEGLGWETPSLLDQSRPPFRSNENSTPPKS